MLSTQMQFGQNTHWQIQAARSKLECRSCAFDPIEDLQTAIDVALQSPLDFVPFDQAFVADDTIALALDPLLPRAGEVAGYVARWLCEHGCSPENIAIVISQCDAGTVDSLAATIKQFAGCQITLFPHDPSDSNHFAYVAANKESEPIYINRKMVDADVLIPISCSRGAKKLDYLGSFSIFPYFSDLATRGHIFSHQRLADQQHHQKLCSAADEAAWWLGFVYGIQIIPAGADQIAGVLAGTKEAVEAEAQRKMSIGWGSTNQQFDLVVALVDSSAGHNGWHELACALRTAYQIAIPGGAIVLCTELSDRPGRALESLKGSGRSPEALAEALSNDDSHDALAAAVVLDVTRDCHVYLVSQLNSNVVEALGMASIEHASELTTLIERHKSCLLLSSAQHSFINA